MFSETLMGNGASSATPPVQNHDMVAWIGHGSATNPDVAALASGPVWQWYGYRGYSWILGKAYASTFSSYTPPNPKHSDVTQLSYGWFAARSHHSGGVNVALADGSVRFVTESVDLDVWHNAGSIADQEPVEGEL